MDSYKLVYIVGFLLLLLLFAQAGSRNVEFADRAFVSIWNSPSIYCEERYHVQLNLSYFDIVENHKDTFAGNEIVIFYGSRIGLYPTIGSDGTFRNGGLPQLANITAHLAKLTKDVESYIPHKDFIGLAVIDWESWRPIFRRDGYNAGMRRYIYASENLVRKKHPDWSKDKIEKEAQKEFETGARIFIEATLEACKKLRPGGYWGLYLFPNCYNYGRGVKTCSKATMEFNDRLSWLYNTSTSLFPSIYVGEAGTAMDKYNHVYGALKEALRVKKLYGAKYLPIVPYTKYKYGNDFYDKADLNSTIRQVAEAGMNGVALWGSSAMFNSKTKCEWFRDYLDSSLGPFIKSVTESARKCSEELCNSHGRCFRTDWSYKSNTLIFESATDGLMARVLKRLTETISGVFRGIRRAVGITNFADSVEELRQRYSGFSCSCFIGWTGQYCLQRSNNIV